MSVSLRSKWFLSSKGIWGSILGGTAATVGWLPVIAVIPPLEVGQTVALGFAGIVGGLLGFWGRWDAYRPLHVFVPYTIEVVGDDG